MKENISAVLVVALALVLGFAGIVSANTGALANFNTQYAGNSFGNSCSICHTTAPTTNPYGAALVGAGGTGGSILPAQFVAVEGLDSDGDTFTNLQEINAGTFPGNPASFPVSQVGEWFKGKVSLKGYEINGSGAIVGKAGGSATAYFNIVDDPTPGSNQYLVTTCIENFDVKGEWHLGQQTAISKDDIYGDPNTATIWDFASDSEMNFYQNIRTYPMFYVKMNGSLTQAKFKSFACQVWDDSELPAFQLGSCKVNFKNIDPSKVPTGATGCIIPLP